MIQEQISLVGQLLVATPHMPDPRFTRAVIYICAHSEDGAMGIVINKPAENIKFRDLINQLGVDNMVDNPIHIYFGGPVESARGFVLHSTDYIHDSTLVVDEKFALTGTLDIIKSIAEGHGPKNSILALGYAGWNEGQLDDEILTNGWLTAPADCELVFRTQNHIKWEMSAQRIGIDLEKISGDLGRA